MNNSLTLTSSGCITGVSSGTTYIGTTTEPNYIGISSPSSFTINPSTSLYIDTNMNKPTQNKVAVFKVTHNDKNEITSTEFIKELWVETKNGQSVDFVVARDKDLAKYNAEDLSIKTLFSVTF